MSSFMAVNVGMKIPGIQTKFKAFVDLPEQLHILSSKSSVQDGALSLVRRAVHLLDMIMGKGGRQQRLSCDLQAPIHSIQHSRWGTTHLMHT